MTKGREKSDDRVVPEGRRKAVPTDASRGGKAITAREATGQLRLAFETADSPQGAVAGTGRGEPPPVPRAVPKSNDTSSMSTSPVATMEKVASRENLERAWEHVAANDGAAGPDKQSVDAMRSCIEDTLQTLHDDLLAGRYRPGAIRRVWIPKSGGGQRGLGIPNVVDRIVQQAVHQVLSPLFDPTFHESSHGFRPGRSCHTAIAEARWHLLDGYEWVVDLDLEKFFDRVHHERLLARLGIRVRDDRILTLVRKMLKAKVVMPDGVVVQTEEGTPQGGPLSPLLSNVVLDELDRELEQRGHRFVRYADDCNIYVRSERAGHRVMASVTRFLESRLRLSVNQAKSAVARSGERHFVGFRIARKLDGTVEVHLSKRSRKRINEKIRQLTPRTWGQSMSACIRRINVYLRGWIGFFRVCTSKTVFETLDGHIRRRLRAILLRHWKTRPTIVKRLIRLGVQSETAKATVYAGRRSWWALSHSPTVDNALRNRSLKKRYGLFSLEKRWQELRREKATGPGRQLSLKGLSAGASRRRSRGCDGPEPARPEEPDVRPTSPVL
jgi:RNA-directed DNA polymerase